MDYNEKAKELADCLPWSMDRAKQMFVPIAAKALRESAEEQLRSLADWIDKGPRTRTAQEIATECDRRAVALFAALRQEGVEP